MTWTTIPPWLYRSTLPDDELQARYVEQAERTLADCMAHREGLEREIRALRATRRGALSAEEWSALADELGERYEWLQEAHDAEARAEAFLGQAHAALAWYQERRRRRGP